MNQPHTHVTPYEPTWESLRNYSVPEWFKDAKLGIFIHWGLYSVPGWAPKRGQLWEVARGRSLRRHVAVSLQPEAGTVR